MHRNILWALRPAALAIALVTACSESATAPDTNGSSSRPLVPEQRPVHFVSSASTDGSVVTLTDDVSGYQYTYDIAKRQLTRSDGVLLYISEDVAPDVATAFAGAVETDPIVMQYDHLTEPDGDPVLPGQCDGQPGSYCDASIGGGVSAPLTINDVPASTKVSNAPLGSKLSMNMRGPATLLSPLSLKPPGTSAHDLFYDDVNVGYDAGSMCTNIVNSFFGRRLNYGDSRRGFLATTLAPVMDHLKGAVADAGVEIIVGLTSWLAAGSMMAGSALAAKVALAASTFKYQQMVNGWIASFWNTYNCSSQVVTTGRYIQQHDGSYILNGPTTEYIYYCEDKPATISFDGGATTHAVRIKECDFKQI